MASLKEIKVRIASIRSTQKITAAMKMVSSAKLHHTQTQTEHTLLYADDENDIVWVGTEIGGISKMFSSRLSLSRPKRSVKLS